MSLRVHIDHTRGPAVIALTGDLDNESSILAHVAASVAIHRAAVSIVDMTGVTFIDASGVTALLLWRHLADTDGLRLVPSASVTRLLDLCGLSAGFDIRRSVNGAIDPQDHAA